MVESHFLVDGFQLTVHRDSYLVYVRPWTGKSRHQDKISDLPDWVFHSPSAIWLYDEDDSLYHRAMDGDRIREQILTSSLSKGA